MISDPTHILPYSLNVTINSIRETQSQSRDPLNFHWKMSTKLANPSTLSQTYWSILKTLVDDKTIPIIPLLLPC